MISVSTRVFKDTSGLIFVREVYDGFFFLWFVSFLFWYYLSAVYSIAKSPHTIIKDRPLKMDHIQQLFFKIDLSESQRLRLPSQKS